MKYREYVNQLLEKYGPAEDDYFIEESYNQFLKGEVNDIKKGKISRTKEGLYCHHIDEDKHISLCAPEFIKLQNAPHEHHTKDKLVYCNLIEHAKLHIMIAIEDPKKGNWTEEDYMVGIGGYINFLRPLIYDWFVLENVPHGTPWMKNCYDAVVMSNEEGVALLKELDGWLIENYPITQAELLQATKESTVFFENR